jgi:enoyl-CoA hydratase/carnithine racemase
MPNYKNIIYEIKDNIGWVTLNRPEKLNAINDDMLFELDDMFELAEQDLDVKVLVIKGAGKAFSVGQDLSGAGTDEVLPPSPRRRLSAKSSLEAARRRNRRWEYIFNLCKPTIAQVHGQCLGAGLYLALACDLTVASDDAIFGDPSLRMGIVPEFPLLAWLVGVKRTSAMVLCGKQFSAREAEESGMINKAVPKVKLRGEVTNLAKGISLLHSDGLAAAKDSINSAMEARGVGPAWTFTSDVALLMQQRSRRPGEFNFEKVRDELGVKAAIEARDKPFPKLD